MFTPEQYRAKADQYTELAKAAGSNGERNEFQNRQRSFSVMADNEQWLADNHDQTMHSIPDSKPREILAAEEEHVLRCLGAALIMQWNTIPTNLQRELFDNAGSMGSLRDIDALRAQIARFLHKHKDDEAGLSEPLSAAQAEPAGSR